jgi:geranylgeranyl pyrophosphate synthase
VGSFDPYVEYGRLLSVAEQQFILDDAEGLVRTVGTLSQLHVPETPTYEVNFYRAFLAFKHRRDAEARMLLGAFKDMLRIDSGQARCTEMSGYVSLHGRVTASLEAYRVMCGEILYGHYERPTRETLFNVAKYWSFVTLLEEKMSN